MLWLNGQRWPSECLAATRLMTVLHHGCFSSFRCEHHKSKLPQHNLHRGCSNMDDLFELHSVTVSAGATEHAARARGLGTESDICSHTSGSLAAPVFCLQLCSHCCVPAGGVSDLEALVAGSRKTRTNVFLFLFPYHSLHSSVQMLMIHPKGNIYTRRRFLLLEWRFFFFFFHLRLELSWLPETALTTHSTCQCLPGDSTNPAFLSLSLSTIAFLPLLTLLLPHSTVFSVKSFIFWALFRYFPLLLVSIISTGIFFSRLQQLCSNKSHNSVLQRVWGRDNCEMTCDLFPLIWENWHASWMMKTSIWSGCFCTAVGLINVDCSPCRLSVDAAAVYYFRFLTAINLHLFFSSSIPDSVLYWCWRVWKYDIFAVSQMRSGLEDWSEPCTSCGWVIFSRPICIKIPRASQSRYCFVFA